MIINLQEIKNANILVIDDEELNIEIIREFLEDEGFTNLTCYTRAEEALAYYRETPPDLVLLDLNMPIMSGFEVMEVFNTIFHNPHPPVLVISAQNDREIRLKALKSRARDFLTKPFDGHEVVRRAYNLLEMHLMHKENILYSEGLEEVVQQRTNELVSTQLEIIERLALAAEYRDDETAAHTIRVGLYVQAIALKMGMNEKEANNLKLAAPMHDLGKIGIPDKILLKPGKFDPDEWEIMKKHAQYGYDILSNSKSILLKTAGIIALTHHEKWDGSGYPEGLKQDDIHLYGRITALADVFDALLMERPYKNAWSVDKAVALINEQSGKHFDPEIVEIFNEILDQLLLIKEAHSD